MIYTIKLKRMQDDVERVYSLQYPLASRVLDLPRELLSGGMREGFEIERGPAPGEGRMRQFVVRAVGNDQYMIVAHCSFRVERETLYVNSIHALGSASYCTDQRELLDLMCARVAYFLALTPPESDPPGDTLEWLSRNFCSAPPFGLENILNGGK